MAAVILRHPGCEAEPRRPPKVMPVEFSPSSGVHDLRPRLRAKAVPGWAKHHPDSIPLPERTPALLLAMTMLQRMPREAAEQVLRDLEQIAGLIDTPAGRQALHIARVMVP